MAARVVRIAMHTIGEVETGLWCEACALPSVIGIDFVLEIGDVPQEIRFMGACEQCGRRSGGEGR